MSVLFILCSGNMGSIQFPLQTSQRFYMLPYHVSSIILAIA